MRAISKLCWSLLVPLAGLACNSEDASPPPAESASGGATNTGAAGTSGATSSASGASGTNASAGGNANSSGAGGNDVSAGGSDTGASGSDAGVGGSGVAGAGGADPGAGGTASGGAPPTNEGWGTTQCKAPTVEVGYDVGQSLGPLVLKDCETGAEATLDELCGADATWIFVAHSHCPTCKATAGFSDSVAEAVANKNVAVAHILYDDNGTSCATWKETYKLAGLPNLRVYEDPTGAVWQQLKTSNYTAPSAFLDRNRVVTYKAHGLSQTKVIEQIDKALAE